MPLSTAVQDSPHCGRGQRGIDFFFKTSPLLSPSVAEKEKNILDYLKKVQKVSSIAVSEEDEKCYPSFSKNEHEAKSGPQSSVTGKNRDAESRCLSRKKYKKGDVKSHNSNVSVCDLTTPTDKQKTSSGATAITSISDSECIADPVSDAAVQIQNVSDGKLPENVQDDKVFPLSTNHQTLDSIKSTVRERSDLTNSEESSSECKILTTKSKDDVKSSCDSRGCAVEKRNIFAFMMANRSKQNEAVRKMAEEEKSPPFEEKDVGDSKESEDCVVVDTGADTMKCSTDKKFNWNKYCGASKKKSTEVDNNEINKKEREITEVLNSSLQDFDLTPKDSIRRRKKCKQAKNIAEKNNTASTKSEIEIISPVKISTREAATSVKQPSPLTSDLEQKPSKCISFSDFIKSMNNNNEEKCEDDNVVEEKNEIQKRETFDIEKCTNVGECHEPVKIFGKTAVEYTGTVKDEGNGNLLAQSSGKTEPLSDDNSKEKACEAVHVPGKLTKKRARKRKISENGSEDDIIDTKPVVVDGERKKTSDVMPESSERRASSASLKKSLEPSKTMRISSFFKKISQEEKDLERSKMVFTVQADVHAPFDGNTKTERKHVHDPLQTQTCGDQEGSQTEEKKEAATKYNGKKNTKRGRKRSVNNHNLDELNKIELLEQITLPKSSPKKALKKISHSYNTNSVDKVQKVTDNTKGEEKKENAAAITPPKEEVTVKGNLVGEKNNQEKDAEVGRRSLRRRKVCKPSSEEEESSCEIFLRAKTRKSKATERNTDAVAACSSNTSSCDKSDQEPTDDVLPSSPDASEHDKENVAHYTSQLVGRPGKLSLRLKRIHHPQQCSNRKESQLLSCKQKGALRENTIHRKTRKMMKTKGIKNYSKRTLRNALKSKTTMKATKEAEVSNDVTLMELDDEVSEENIALKVLTRRRKSPRALLKSLPPKGKSKKNLVQTRCRRRKKSESEDSPDKQHDTLRRSSRHATVATKKYFEEITIEDEGDIPKKNKNCKKETANKDAKLAPIFCKRPQSPPCVEILKMVSLSPKRLKARQEFLNSSMPDEIKKQVSTEKSLEDDLSSWPPFPTVSHIQQRDEKDPLWKLDIPDISQKKEDFSLPSNLENPKFDQILTNIAKGKVPKNGLNLHSPLLELGDIAFSLSCMKLKYPNFPVYKVFKAYYGMKKEAVEAYRKEVQKEDNVIHLDDDEESPGKRKRKRKNKLSRNKRVKLGTNTMKTTETQEQQGKESPAPWQERTPHAWTHVFTPKSASQVIGNTVHVKKLKLWLQEWKGKHQVKPRKRGKKSASKGDFIDESDESSCEDDEDDFVNTYLLSGPPGIGKTAAVYALANELGYKVLEVNASTRRSGRQVMSQLAEATQSHSLPKTTAQPSSALSTLFAAKNSNSAKVTSKKDPRQREDSQGCEDADKMKSVSLVLFEDIDIVFEEWDEGFMSTVNSLMATSKRPIILTVTQASPTILSRIKGNFEMMKFVPPPQEQTAHHLKLIALANGHHICHQDAECLVHLNKGDIRKSLVDLQLLVQSGSSYNVCDCALPENIISSSTKSVNKLDDIQGDNCLRDVFPQATASLLEDNKQVKFYKVGLWGKLDAKASFDTLVTQVKSKQLCDREEVCWKQLESNHSFVLPFPKSEREESCPKYPLQSTDSLLKDSCLWKRHSWLCIDEDEEDLKPEPVKMESETDSKLGDPPEIRNAAHLCMKSLANLYDSYAQLDLLDSSQVILYHEREIRDRGWWIKQPTAGLSDNLNNHHPHWSPHGVSNSDVIQELTQRAVKQCAGEVTSALSGVTAQGWPQLSLPCDPRQRTPDLMLQCSNSQCERIKHRSIMENLSDQLPVVNHLSRSAGMDYLSTLRSMARQDELATALSKKRRGRRFFSHLAQLGLVVSAQDRIALANALFS